MKDFIALYSTTPSSQQEKSLDYYIIRFFNLPSHNPSMLQKTYRNMFPEREHSSKFPIGPFYDITELDRYCFQTVQQFNLEGVGLLDLERYNRLLDEIHNLVELQMALSKKCDYIENPDYRKSGILNKLLN